MDQDQDEPQKPKSTTDGKQMAGHSYSTRSTVKRTSHSDDDSGGSHAQQPPFKRQTRPGAKQAGKSVGIINDDMTPDSNAVDTNTVDENTAAQTALQNDLVLESLLRHMNRSDLLSCRVVNKQWQDEATKELRRRKLVIKFSFPSNGNKMSRIIAFQDMCRRLSECRTPSLLSSFEVKTVARNDLGAAGLRNIFATVGNQLKHLTLRLNHWGNWSFSESSSMMTDLGNLLFRQAPNLEFLEIKFDLSDNFTDTWEALDSSDRPQNSKIEFGLLPNLKTFIVDGTPPSKFFADVINAAVNLRSVGGDWSTSSLIKWFVTAEGRPTPLRGSSLACLTYFLGAEGRHKIHLLKSFSIYLLDDFDVQHVERQIELIETFLTMHKQNLQLETFTCVSRLFDEDVSFALRIVGVINQILKCSSESLQKLRIEPMKWFKYLLIIPRLPKLQEICFDCFWNIHDGPDSGCFFPRGFKLNNSFPNVSTIVLLRCFLSFFQTFVELVEIEMAEPVPGVRRIVIDEEKDGSSVPPLVSDFHHIFPNLLSISYVKRDNYYEI